MMSLEYDKIGYCCKCHIKVAEVCDKNVKLMPIYREAIFLLNDQSKMKIALCEECYGTLKKEDSDLIMSSVKRGWYKEVEGFNHWTREKKDSYMDTYNSKSILDRVDSHWKEK